jgi:essential nuclear protein 1
VKVDSLPPKVIEVYTDIGELLKRYRSGKLPKAVKVLPHLKYWEQILWLTSPESWSASGTYAVTRVFTSNLNVKLVQRFYNLVLLEKCRDDVQQNNKLNFHLYNALKKSLFKPAAFYKGFLLPLLQSGTCTNREAVVFSSVLSKASVPAIHSAAALMRILEIPYSPAICVVIKQIIAKKYAFPQRVVDSLLQYFLAFKTRSNAEVTLIWHQTLLTLVQRYKSHFGGNDREQVFSLLSFHPHPTIGSEIRRELSAV